MQATLTSKGQMTLPSAVRAQLGLEAGDHLMVTVQDADTIILTRRPTVSVTALRGLLSRPLRALTIEEMDAGVAAHLGARHKSGSKS